MIPPTPLYTFQNCTAAYQCRWSLAIFPKNPLPPADDWFSKLNVALQPDSIRVLETLSQQNNVVLFLLSTTPDVSPPQIVRLIKGRLQHLLRPICSVQYRRNFRLTSVGDTTAHLVENYVAKQTERHPLADPMSQAAMAAFQISFPVDLTEPVNSAHGQYVLALHVVLVTAQRWRTADARFHHMTQDAILWIASKKKHEVSRLAILPDHVHFTVRVPYESSPAEVALSYMNNVAFRHDMLRLWMSSFYVGTIGPYDMDAIRRGKA